MHLASRSAIMPCLVICHSVGCCADVNLWFIFFPTGGSMELSPPDDDDRAGSDVEEIEAKAREQERLLSATDDDSPTTDPKLAGRCRALYLKFYPGGAAIASCPAVHRSSALRPPEPPYWGRLGRLCEAVNRISSPPSPRCAIVTVGRRPRDRKCLLRMCVH